jgi:autotransporter translocation and assembly factor TamB
MTKGRKIATIVGLSLAGLIVVVVVAALIVLNTAWFRGWVRQKIITTVEQSTGGAVDVQAFEFNPWKMRAVVDGLVLHGTEPVGSPPLFEAKRITVDLSVLSSLHNFIDLRSLVVDQPEADVIVYADGSTNVPSPRIPQKPGNKSGLATVVDLAIGHFALNNGSFTFADRKMPLDARGENLRAQLYYNPVQADYQGQLSIRPMNLVYGRNVPVNVDVTLPVTIGKDSIEVQNAKLTTPDSHLLIDASMKNMKSPDISTHVNGQVSVPEMEKVAGMSIAPPAVAASPAGFANVNVAMTMNNGDINVQTAQIRIGGSTIEGSGLLKSSDPPLGFHFKTHLALGELGKLFRTPQRPQGTVDVNGVMQLVDSSGFQFSGDIQARDVSFLASGHRYGHIDLASQAKASSHSVTLTGMRLAAFGGEFTGDASLADMREFQVKGDLRHFDIARLAETFANKRVGYDGIVSGSIAARGDLKAPGTKSLVANAHLTIAPGAHGIPLRGRLAAAYNGAAGTLVVDNSFIGLPHSRIGVSGSVGRELRVTLASSNLGDFKPALDLASSKPSSTMPVSLRPNGSAAVNATVSGSIGNPRIEANVTLANFAIEDRPFDRMTADLSANSSGAAIRNAVLARGAMHAQLAASVGLHQWSPKSYDPLSANATIQNADLSDLLAMAGERNAPATGVLNASAQVNGTVGDPQGSVHLAVVNGTIEHEPFDRLQGQVDLRDQLVSIPAITLTAGSAQVHLSAQFRHPRDSFTTGHIDAHLASNPVNLGQLKQLAKQRPGLSGTVQVNFSASGDLASKQGQTSFELASVNGEASVHGLITAGQNYGDLTASARTAGNTVSYRVDSDFAKSSIQVAGQTQLVAEYPTSATATIARLPIQEVLAVAGHGDMNAKGMLAANASVNGTLNNPQATLTATLTAADIYNQPVDRIETRVNYTAQLIDVPQLDISAGPSHIALAASYTHAKGDLESGRLKFELADSTLDLGHIAALAEVRPGLSGTVQMKADGAATLQQAAGKPSVQLASLNANVNANGLAVNGTPIGGLRLSAQTAGRLVRFQLDSNLAQARIQGSGQAQLAADYPVNARLSFTDVTYAGLRPLLGEAGPQPDFNALVDGQVTLDGPIMRPDALRGTLELPKVQMSVHPRAATPGRTITIQNPQPVVVALDRSVITIRSARLTGRSTDISLSGTAGIRGSSPLNLTLAANTNLKLLQDIDKDIYSSGAIVVNAVARGVVSKPAINGRLELKQASVNMISAPNGISNANGVILFNGRSATIQNLSGQSGGGTVGATGFLSFSGPALGYGLKVTASNVQVRYPPGASVTAGANIELTGTSKRSLLSGSVTIDQIGYSTTTDFGSMLSSSSEPAAVPSAPSGILAGMRLDVHIRTAPGVAVQTALAQNLQADVDLTLRGTLANPGMLGRINITEGTLIFFGTKYTVNRGSISFFNPFRIYPILDVNLETVAKGVDVVLTVSGPIDNMKLSYHSDPPIEFSELVQLLATGKVPTSDPTLLAREPSPPPQTFQQMGESALVSQAVANPVAGRLQRVFGVSQLKIDPTFTSGSMLPTARVTLQQQVTSNVTFTYITNLSQANDLIIRAEWTIDPRWSAVLTRDENGFVGLDIFYKRRFR